MAPEESLSAHSHEAILIQVSGVQVRDLPIGPTEAFVLSRIDGRSSEAELAEAVGLSEANLQGIVRRLLALGAVERCLPPGSVARGQSLRSGAHSIPLISHEQQAVEQQTVEQQTVGQQTVELNPEQQRVLIDLDRRRQTLTHYELLGVDASADAKAIRAAYYELVHVYHPDRYFGKQLGRFAAPLLRVFAAFTEAYEVLRRAESRGEYDRYILARQRTLDFDRYCHESAPESSPPPATKESIAPPSGTLRRSSEVPASDPEVRRRALARKLGHSSAPPPRSSSSSLPSVNASGLAAAELKRRYDQRLQQSGDEQRDHYVALSKEAADRNDLIAAANALRIACSLAPGNLELAGDLAELERRAAAGLWEAYLERAKYAAVEGRPAEAAESYERAALGQPSPSLFERAAFYTLEAGGDLKRASKLAKQAVSLAPNSAKCRLTLAQVYAAAQLRESALAELERARALEPNQPIIKEWIARVKREG